MTGNETTLSHWELWMRAQGLSPRTINERLGTVRNLLRHARTMATALEPEHIQAWLARDMSGATRATYHASIRAFAKWMQRTGLREDNPTERTPSPKRPKSRPRPLTGDQLDALLRACNRRRTRAYVLLGAFAGLRVHEIAKVRGEDIDPWSESITVLGKGGKVARLPLHDELIAEARRWPSQGYWFPTYVPSSKPHISSQAVSLAISDAMRRAGVRATPHQLRHTYGTELVRQGVHLRVVQELMRHESPASTAIYTEVDLDQMREGVKALSLPRRAA
ncbi:hypothetical protein ABE10_31630 [Bacillus toyonensis]|nr:hypothetical protein [Bacillus toyonensis]